MGHDACGFSETPQVYSTIKPEDEVTEQDEEDFGKRARWSGIEPDK